MANQRLAAHIPLTAAARRALRGKDKLTASVRVTVRNRAPNRENMVRVQLPN